MESSLGASEAIIETLISRGWCFGNVDHVKALIVVQSVLHGEDFTVDLVESELANMDLRSIGGKSLPDPSLVRKSSHLQGPKVLQISSARDISRSSTADSSGNSHHQRLLRLVLTDGHSEITAIEYSHIPSILNDVVPGTKVRLGSKTMTHSGIVLLNPKVITVLGGVVQSLYEEWQMNKKYSGLSRSTLRQSQESDTGGPPPFEKLGVGLPSFQSAQHSGSSYQESPGAVFKGSRPYHADKGRNHEFRQVSTLQKLDAKASSTENDTRSVSTEQTEEKPGTSNARPKEVAESLPVQNQAAAQKLLLKMNQTDHGSRGRKYRGKGKEVESSVYTLDEWERRKTGPNPSLLEAIPDVSQDEDLARQLQHQMDLEDLHVQRGPHRMGEEDLRMSMFNFERVAAKDYGNTGFRGRGRGRSRGRGRGRGRGRFG